MEYTTKAVTADQFINEINTIKAQGNFTVDMAGEMNRSWATLKATLPVDEQAADEVRVRSAFDTNVSGTTSPFQAVRAGSTNDPVVPAPRVVAATSATTVQGFIDQIKSTGTFSNAQWQIFKKTLPINQQGDAEKVVREVLANTVPGIIRTN